MDDLDLLARAEEAHLFAYPARLTVVGRGGASNLRLPALIKDITHAGALVEIEAGHHHDLGERLGEGRVRLEFSGEGGVNIALVGQVATSLRRPAGQVLAQVNFDNIHLSEVDEVRALRGAAAKDQRLLWDLWDRLQEGGN